MNIWFKVKIQILLKINYLFTIFVDKILDILMTDILKYCFFINKYKIS